jgi:uncharacterized protein (TIGR02246 family)
MRRFSILFAAFGLLWLQVAAAQNVTSPAAVVDAWVKDWNAHDAKAIGEMLTPDVDFVLVDGRWLQGRAQFVQVHGDQFAGRYSQSEFATDGVPHVTLLQPQVALVQWRWIITRVRNPDGTPAPAYRGVFTWVLVQQQGNWAIRAAQNTVAKSPTTGH